MIAEAKEAEDHVFHTVRIQVTFLMKTKHRHVIGLTVISLILPASADIIYSNLQNIAIPNTYAGVYLDVDGSNGWNTNMFSPVSGWDINPFFGGQEIASSPAFQPVRGGTGSSSPMVDLAAGATVGSGSVFATDYGGTGYGWSDTHLGSGTNQFPAGQEGYIGFRLNNVGYGWMRVVLGGTTPVIKDWAYDTAGSGGSIVTGNVLQDGTTVTLNSAGGSFTLGSQITGANSVLKTGANSVTLTGTDNYAGTTTINAGTLSIATAATTGSGAVTVNNADTKLTGTGTVGGNTTVNSGAILAPGNNVGKVSFAGDLTHGAGSIFEWELASDPSGTTRGTDYDAVNVAGTLGGSDAIFRVVLNGTQDFSGAFWDSTHTWSDIFKASDGGANLNFASIFSSVQYWNSATGNLGTPTNQGTFTISGSSLTWTAVPEPTAALAGILLGAGLLRRRR